jgi:hypothetical protein
MTEEFNMGSLRKGPPMGKQEVPKKEDGLTKKHVADLIEMAWDKHSNQMRKEMDEMGAISRASKDELQKMVQEIIARQKDINDKVRVPLSTTWGALRKSMLGRYGGNHPLGDKRRQENGIALVETMDELLKMLLGDS